MADTSFRRLPIDLYDEDRVLPTDLYPADPRGAAQVLADAKAKLQNVRSALQRGDSTGALVTALESPAYGDGVDEAKAISLQSILALLSSVKSTDLPTLLSSLDNTQQVTLMKYLYKVMQNISEEGEGSGVNGNVVLGWHEKLVEIAGTGCIVRVMTDYKRV